MLNIGFDYDKCLTDPIVKMYCQELIKRGYDIFVISKRFQCGVNGLYGKSCSMIKNCLEIGISLNDIIFTNMKSKVESIVKNNIQIFLDDNILNVSEINNNTSCRVILYENDKKFIEQIEQLIKINK